MFIKIVKKFSEWKYRDLFILSVLFFVGFFLRVYLIDKNLFFGPEQGRDLLVVKDIVVNHKLVLIGPKTAVDGVFHGPLYYYLATIPFLLSKGNPLFIELFFIFLNSLSVVFLYGLVKELFNKRVALISSTLFTFSFGLIVMSRWLSHPPLIIPISCIFFLFLVKFLKGNDKYLIPVAVTFGFASQAEFTDFLIFSFILFFTVIVFWRRFLKIKLKPLIVSVFVVLLGAFGNFLLFDVRHNLLITQSFIKLLTKHSGFYGTFVDSLSTSINNFSQIFNDSITPSHPLAGTVVFFLSLICLFTVFNKNKLSASIMFIWIFSPFVAFVILKYNPLYHYFAGVLVAIIILTAVLIERIWSFKNFLGFSLILSLGLINLFAWQNFLPSNSYVFFQTPQPGLKYSDQVAVIKEIYNQSNGKPFYFQSYTIPYWLQEEWEYLFWYYGNSTYGYIPENKNIKILFVIIQDDPNNAAFQNNWLKNTVSKWGIKQSEFRYGALRVQRLNSL